MSAKRSAGRGCAGRSGPERHRNRAADTWRKQMLTAAITGFAAVETVAEPPAAPLLPAPAVAGEPSGPATMDIAVEMELPNGARVRVGNDAGAALLCDVFAALDRR